MRTTSITAARADAVHYATSLALTAIVGRGFTHAGIATPGSWPRTSDRPCRVRMGLQHDSALAGPTPHPGGGRARGARLSGTQVVRVYDGLMGHVNLDRELTRARNSYLGSVRRLDEAMQTFNMTEVPLMPTVDDRRFAPWSPRDTAVMRACADAWSAVVAAHRGYVAAERDLAANDPA
jgi:hypothetical protein